ncbi:MAG TPA: DUF503 domain-containing protein [Vicinamibacteria bacterium]|nr:DUF503 domain-containing protein [Vicinamibacteria bacterium]
MSSRARADRESGAPIVGLIVIELHFPEARSLKAKRITVKSIKDRLKRRFNVAIAETGYLELWQRAELCAVSVSGTRSVLESELEAVSRELERHFPSELVGIRLELYE